jgi:hypothetical protein
MSDFSGSCSTGDGNAGSPALFDTGQGLSVLYKNRYLYSRHNPSRSAVQTVRQTDIPPETLVLCISPLLGYALEELMEKLPASSFVLALERDENLMALSVTRIARQVLSNPSFKYIRTSSAFKVLQTINSLSAGPFRRCLRLDLSGGSALYPVFYPEIVSSIDEYISRFWRNQLTLMRLGRNYARNLFRNLETLPDSFILPRANTGKPVFVAGAGPSLEQAMPFLRQHRESLFLLAVDTALKPLGEALLAPDAIVLVESQFWIDRAFIGFRDSKIPVFADLTARPSAVNVTGGPVYFFFSEYTKSTFISRLGETGILPLVIPPLGSVGLSAGISVLFSGLDFSWSDGFTHCRGAPAVQELLNSTTRFFSVVNSQPSFSTGSFLAPGKNRRQVYTDTTLSGYAALCAAQFGNTSVTAKETEQKRIYFDLGTSGLQTGCTPLTFGQAGEFCTSSKHAQTFNEKAIQFRNTDSKISVKSFLENEKKMLVKLKELLTGKQKIQAADKEIARLVTEMDYLYLHFPDGHRGYSSEKNFLNRVRIELEYFLKTLDHP